MENTDLDSTKSRVKAAKIADISIFTLCFIHLILWIMRASYITGFHTGSWAAWVYNHLYTIMYYALYVLPIVLGFSVINRKLSVDSFAFLSFKSLVITYVLIFILR
ncbi:hypothetical protein [Myroides sp. WP-1]|uniref:hypothetical protein n=1 Tax=Myroides sp. WP-1 TaxID=2759944 RepID=UPI0015F81A8F|nr:hypothetical protein [Myroides sp. WP-1]MBB1140099.1 hypothetical protein [Myroides sp. WP-1]